MFWLTPLFVLLPSLASAVGQPGSRWSPEEVARTKERIWKILINPKKFVGKSKKPKEDGDCGSDCWKDCDAFDRSRHHPFCTHCDDVICPAKYPKCQCCTGWCEMPVSTQAPTAAKILRLSFHDCLKYTDGTGGCDGCLAWEGMGISFQKKDEPSGNGPYDKTFSDPGDITNGKGDNNGLAMTVLALEHVFKDSNLGDNGESLMTSGKSRADLWALAGMVAVEYSINENNLACTAATLPWTRKGAGASGCGRRDMDSLDCFIQMPRIPFRTGRTDCAPGAEPYIASKTEVHPSPFANGPMTLQWFETNFGLTNPKEVVALMGAHTLGKLDQRNSFFKYFWNRGEHSYFNNQFYKNIVDENDVAIQCMKSATEGFIFIGMPNGTAGAVTYKAHGRGWFQGGGPFSWRRNLDLCYDGQIGKSGMTRMLKVFGSESEVNRNCYNPSTQLESGGPGWTCADACYTPDDFVDEVMLNSDMGLYLDFTVDQATGRQLGLGEDGTVSCPGLVDETRFSELWREGRRSGATIANCAKASTANLVESYANDQATWVSDFASVFDKMLVNGYDGSTLDVAEYGCCTRNPPSMDQKSKKGSKFECDPNATC